MANKLSCSNGITIVSGAWLTDGIDLALKGVTIVRLIQTNENGGRGMKRRVKYLGLATVLLILAAPVAKADVVFVDTFFTDGPLNGPDGELAYINANYDPDADTFIDKFEGDGTDTGITVDINDATATISWDFTGTTSEMQYILLKDGSIQGEGHLYTLYTVTDDQKVSSNGDQTVEFVDPPDGTFDRQISHISFFGGRGGEQVPEPTTLLLLGAGLAGIGFARRRMKP